MYPRQKIIEQLPGREKLGISLVFEMTGCCTEKKGSPCDQVCDHPHRLINKESQPMRAVWVVLSHH
jgi:hypothetical protein